MKLRGKLTLAFLGVTVVPLALALGLFAWQADRELREELERGIASARSGVGKRLERFEALTGEALERIAEDPIIRYLAQDLKWDRFYGDQEKERDLVLGASRLMTVPQLDVLKIVDAARGNQVIAMGHRRGVEPPDDLAVEVSRGGGTLWRVERFPEGGATVPAWTFEVAHPVGERLVLVGGVRVTGTMLANLVAGLRGNLEIAMREPNDVLVATTFPDDALPADVASDYEIATLRRPLGDATGGRVTFSLYLSRAELRRTLGNLFQFGAVLGGFGLLVSLILAFLVSRAIVQPVRALAAGADALARGDREQQIPRTTRDEVGELVASFNRLAADLAYSEKRLVQAERIAAWKDIARQIAHEVKNPLFPIQTSVETLRRARERQHPRFDEIFEEATRTTLEEVARLERIVSEFSRFARLPAPKPQAGDLGVVVHDACSLFGASVAAVSVVEELAGDLPTAHFDPTLMGQVVNNLLKNAVEAAGAGGRVRVRTAAVSGGVLLTVEDDGPGIPVDRREDVFVPYETDKEGGTGLGLAIVRRIVVEHGGTVTIGDSELGGAKFEVRLPLLTPA